MLTGLEILRNLITTGGDEDPPPTVTPPEDTPPADTPPADAPPEGDEATVPIGELRKLRAEAAKHRTAKVAAEEKLLKFQTEQKEAQRAAQLAKMEETDRLKAEKADSDAKVLALQARADRMAKESAIINAASRLRFQNPKDAAALVAVSSLVVDANGNVNQAEADALVQELAEGREYLLVPLKEEAPPSFGGGAGNPPVDTEYTPRARLVNKDEVTRLKEQLAAGQKAGTLSGTQIVDIRHKIYDLNRQALKQDGRTSSKDRIARRVQEEQNKL